MYQTAFWLILCLPLAGSSSFAGEPAGPVDVQTLKRIEAAVPAAAAVKPARPRKVLVFTESAKEVEGPPDTRA